MLFSTGLTLTLMLKLFAALFLIRQFIFKVKFASKTFTGVDLEKKCAQIRLLLRVVTQSLRSNKDRWVI